MIRYWKNILVCFVVVTVDGILLTKAGTMTGGTSGGMEARSHKWDDKKIEGIVVVVFYCASVSN